MSSRLLIPPFDPLLIDSDYDYPDNCDTARRDLNLLVSALVSVTGASFKTINAEINNAMGVFARDRASLSQLHVGIGLARAELEQAWAAKDAAVTPEPPPLSTRNRLGVREQEPAAVTGGAAGIAAAFDTIVQAALIAEAPTGTSTDSVVHELSTLQQALTLLELTADILTGELYAVLLAAMAARGMRHLDLAEIVGADPGDPRDAEIEIDEQIDAALELRADTLASQMCGTDVRRVQLPGRGRFLTAMVNTYMTELLAAVRDDAGDRAVAALTNVVTAWRERRGLAETWNMLASIQNQLDQPPGSTGNADPEPQFAALTLDPEAAPIPLSGAHVHYHTARQRHLGTMLDELQDRGWLRWRWDYNTRDRCAIFHLSGADGEQAFGTRSAETIVQTLCDKLGIRWKPVPPPGGTGQLHAVMEWIAAGTTIADSACPGDTNTD